MKLKQVMKKSSISELCFNYEMNIKTYHLWLKIDM